MKGRIKMIETLKNNPQQVGNSRLVPDVTFSTKTGKELKMQLLIPWSFEMDSSQVYPTVIFLQGSGWTFPDVTYELPQLAEFSRQGYVVATITHRSYLDGEAMPAFLEDSKTAIRFLRSHWKEYGVNPEKIGFWGTSSGGNTAQLVALTGDDPRYQTSEWSNVSDQISCAVSCFGPTDLNELYQESGKQFEEGNEQRIQQMLGGSLSQKQELIQAMSPIKIVDDRKTECPLFLLHGTADRVVPCQQSEQMFDKVTQAGILSQLLLVEGADHEGDFWSEAVYNRILHFFDSYLK